MDAKFNKREHLVSNRLMETLFSSGSKSMSAYPLRAVFRTVPRTETDVPVQVLVSVSKRRFKHAVDRNRVKRQLREAYRHAKQRLVEAVADDETLLLGLMWMADRHAPSDKVAHQVEALLVRIAEKL